MARRDRPLAAATAHSTHQGTRVKVQNWLFARFEKELKKAQLAARLRGEEDALSRMSGTLQLKERQEARGRC